MIGVVWLLLVLPTGPVSGAEGFGPDRFGPGDRRSADGTDTRPVVTVEHALVTAAEEARLPARRDGILADFAVAEGSDVEAGAILATLDSVEASARLTLADERLSAAQRAAGSDHLAAAAVVASDFASYRRTLYQAVHTGHRAALTDLTLAQAVADHDRAVLEAEKAVLDQRLAEHEAAIRRAERRLAAIELDDHTLHAPAAGVIAERLVKRGEFVHRGQPVVHWVRMDELTVEAFVPVAACDPATLTGGTVELIAELGGGTAEAFSGVVTFVSPILETDGAYRIRATVANRRQTNAWRLRPGMVGRLSVTPPSPPSRVTTAAPPTGTDTDMNTDTDTSEMREPTERDDVSEPVHAEAAPRDMTFRVQEMPHVTDRLDLDMILAGPVLWAIPRVAPSDGPDASEAGDGDRL